METVMANRTIMEQWWKDIDRGWPNCSGEKLFQRHSIHQKSHMEWPGIESGSRRWYAGDICVIVTKAKWVAYVSAT